MDHIDLTRYKDKDLNRRVIINSKMSKKWAESCEHCTEVITHCCHQGCNVQTQWAKFGNHSQSETSASLHLYIYNNKEWTKITAGDGGQHRWKKKPQTL